MRLALACLTLLPCAVWAENFTISSAPGAVTVYADGGVVTREITLDVSAGRHEVALPGLPRSLNPEMIRVSLEGAALSATEFRANAVPPPPDADSAAIEAARDRIEAAEEALKALDDAVAEARFAAKGAEARTAFLGGLGKNEGIASDAEALRALAQMIGAETVTAAQEALQAEQEARRINKARPDLEEELKDARAALEALTPPPEETAQLTLGLAAEAAGEVAISVTYVVAAQWAPIYDIYLNEDRLALRRGAMVSQWSGEAWQDVALTLSTFRLSDQTAPREVMPIPLTIGDPAAPSPQPAPLVLGRAAKMQMDAAPVMVEEAATASFDGPGVTYSAPAPVSVASGVDAVRVALDRLEFAADRFARAAPRFDQTAFLMAGFVNDTQEPLLAANSASLYLDNALIGQTWFEEVPAGGEAELAFGPIEALRLRYTVLDENEGDRGIISRSNMKTEAVRMDIENIGSEDWEVQVQAAVPYAIQEDLEIDWQASPPPDSQNIKDKRGVLQWDSSVPAGTVTSIRVETDIRWPEGKVLR